jgi:hypothetical protein
VEAPIGRSISGGMAVGLDGNSAGDLSDTGSLSSEMLFPPKLIPVRTDHGRINAARR